MTAQCCLQMHNPVKNAARCCRYCFPPEMQKAMDPIMRHTAHMKNLVFPLLVGQNRKMDQTGGDSHRIHLPHQGADPFFIPKDIGEIGELAPYIMVRDSLMLEALLDFAGSKSCCNVQKDNMFHKVSD